MLAFLSLNMNCEEIEIGSRKIFEVDINSLTNGIGNGRYDTAIIICIAFFNVISEIIWKIELYFRYVLIQIKYILKIDTVYPYFSAITENLNKSNLNKYTITFMVYLNFVLFAVICVYILNEPIDTNLLKMNYAIYTIVYLYSISIICHNCTFFSKLFMDVLMQLTLYHIYKLNNDNNPTSYAKWNGVIMEHIHHTDLINIQ
ncbi:hypothetical protein A3Q56_08161 [Intoshia linei]|uniref:Uncharacterized protein n=1 Tax=Intoshia linei TaxID=1819745 RepID=A0A177AS30_9BILA|nr:hypothetical protein A3Q56_08161 [Intoshia linei]